MATKKAATKAAPAKEETLPATIAPSAPPVTVFEGAAPLMHETMLASDMIIPRIVVLQGQSKLVTSGQGKVGDMVFSSTGRKLTDPLSGMINIIPLTYRSTWVHCVKKGTKFVWESEEERNASNETAIYPERNHQGLEYQHNRNFDVFALLESDIVASIEAEKTGEIDIDRIVMPVLISFRRSNYHAGKSLVNFFQRVQAAQKRFNVAPFHYTKELGSFISSKDDNNFGIFVTNEASGKLSAHPYGKEIVAQANAWYSQVARGAIKVESENEGSAGTTEAAPGSDRKDF